MAWGGKGAVLQAGPSDGSGVDVAEPEACGGGVDGRVRGVYLPAAARVPPPVRRGRRVAEGVAEQSGLQELQVVHDGGGLGPAQTLPACGAARRCLGRGRFPAPTLLSRAGGGGVVHTVH